MNPITFNRVVAAVAIGSSLIIGLGSPETASADRGTQSDRAERVQAKDKGGAEPGTEKAERQERSQQARAQMAPAQQQARAQMAPTQQQARTQMAPAQQQARTQMAPMQPQARNEVSPRGRPGQSPEQSRPDWRQAQSRAPEVVAQDQERYREQIEQPQSRQRQQPQFARGAEPIVRAPTREDRAEMEAQTSPWREDRNGRENRKVRQEQLRAAEPPQESLSRQERQQVEQYQRQTEYRLARAEQHVQTLQRQNRHSQYRYQQQYYDRVRNQRVRYNWQNYNYYNDPYFYSASNYRYYRGGNYFRISWYGANLLQQAVNLGYSEGLLAGRADRYDRWGYNYRDSYVYQDASYGYRGYYVNQSEYNYYFRQGFRRGYEDGYYGRHRYGTYYNGADILLGPVMSLILNFQIYR